MKYEELKNLLMDISYATGFTVYYDNKYRTYDLQLYRNRRRTIRVSLCNSLDECYEKVKKRIEEVQGDD